MSSHRERCRRKRRYSGHGEAREVLRALARKGSHRAQGMTSYRCPFPPEHYHLGHVPSVESLKSIAREIRGL